MDGYLDGHWDLDILLSFFLLPRFFSALPVTGVRERMVQRYLPSSSLNCSRGLSPWVSRRWDEKG